jgi:hypothetical protein
MAIYMDSTLGLILINFVAKQTKLVVVLCNGGQLALFKECDSLN